jgi:Protein of unknown function (DUF4236)
MAFRFRRSARLGPLRLNFTGQGLSSISLGGPGASLNLPVNRRGGPRTTLGLPGTGLSWTLEAGHQSAAPQGVGPPGADSLAARPWGAGDAVGLPNSRRLRTSQLEAFRQSCLRLLQQRLFAPGAPGQHLWQHQLVSRLLSEPDLGARNANQLAAIATPGALEDYLGRARSQDEIKRRCQRCVDAVSMALALVAHRGW